MSIPFSINTPSVSFPVTEVSNGNDPLVYNENTNSIHYIDRSNKDGLVMTSVNNKTMFSYPGFNDSMYRRIIL